MNRRITYPSSFRNTIGSLNTLKIFLFHNSHRMLLKSTSFVLPDKVHKEFWDSIVD